MINLSINLKNCEMRKHLDFYYKCLKSGFMPDPGLCLCDDHIDTNLLLLFVPLNKTMYEDYWASGNRYDHKVYQFTPLRQNIVLLMAAMNNEL